MLNIVPHCRADFQEFFEKSGLFVEPHFLSHHPFLLFVLDTYELHIQPVTTVEEILKGKDEWLVMCQWPGKMRSDYFKFTVGDLRKYTEEHPETMRGRWQF